MADLERSTDVKESYGAQALMAMVPGVLALIIGGIIVAYRSQVFIWLGLLLMVFGLAAIVFGIVQLTKIKKVQTVPVVCPFCGATNELGEAPRKDFTCSGCHRSVPVRDGRVLQVWQVQCGYCGTLNFYSEKSTGLICETCARQIPISVDEDLEAQKRMEHYAFQEDPLPYDLVLTARGTKQEELILHLQKVLALNRNQVKQIIEQVPVVLLTGIPKKKAELLRQELIAHGGRAEVQQTPEQ